MHAPRQNTYTRTRGFTLLFAVTISAIVISIGFSIFNIMLKETKLSFAGKESQYAFYAADSGLECTLYWDYQFESFSTSTSAAIECEGESFTVGGNGYSPGVSEITVHFAGGYCAIVRVWQYESPRRTTVESRGYNTCDTNSPIRVERAIRATY